MEQYFNYLHYRFNVTKAKFLAKNYKPVVENPRWKWLTPFAEYSDEAIDEPIIFATIVLENKVYRLLVIGYLKVDKALQEGEQVQTVTLNLKDTLKILITHRSHLIEMRQQGKALGLL
jgi:hypothetical protein